MKTVPSLLLGPVEREEKVNSCEEKLGTRAAIDFFLAPVFTSTLCSKE